MEQLAQRSAYFLGLLMGLRHTASEMTGGEDKRVCGLRKWVGIGGDGWRRADFRRPISAFSSITTGGEETAVVCSEEGETSNKSATGWETSKLSLGSGGKQEEDVCV